ncbi:hypothetical protein ACWKWV_09805 [Castellaniella ginsengisoli]
MAQPPRYQRTKDFGTDYPDQTDNQAINNELDSVARTTDGLRTNLAKIQRDDGGLRDGIVTKDALAQPLKQELYDEFSQNVTAAVETAQQAAGDANAAALAAAGSAASAATSAADAAGSLATIAGAVASTTASASAAATSATNAAASEVAAATSAGASATSAGNASTAASAAASSATAAAGSASSAASAAADANAAKAAAAGSATAAAGSASTASSAASAAAASATSAQESADRAEAAPALSPWTGRMIGEEFPLHPNAPLPPTDDPAFRYVILTAGLDSAGQYNEGVLTDETVTGSDPTITATAVVSLAGSPMDGQTIDLINTSRTFLRPGAPGPIVDSQNAAHFHTGTAASAGSHAHGTYLPSGAGSAYPGVADNAGNPLTKKSSNSSTSVATTSAGAHSHPLTIDNDGGAEAAPRHIPRPYLMRIL